MFKQDGFFYILQCCSCTQGGGILLARRSLIMRYITLGYYSKLESIAVAHAGETKWRVVVFGLKDD